MTIIKYDYLFKINQKYNLFNLINYINHKYYKCGFERVIACLLQIEKEEQDQDIILLGNIHTYCKWGIHYNEKDEYNHLPLIKIWGNR